MLSVQAVTTFFDDDVGVDVDCGGNFGADRDLAPVIDDNANGGSGVAQTDDG